MDTGIYGHSKNRAVRTDRRRIKAQSMKLRWASDAPTWPGKAEITIAQAMGFLKEAGAVIPRPDETSSRGPAGLPRTTERPVRKP